MKNRQDFQKMRQDEIVEMLKKRAASYVPEWHFDEENPDIGTALMLVYAKMYEGTLRKYSCLPKKNEIAFFNALDAKRLPAVPSEGYVSFSMVNDEVGGQEMEAGVELMAQGQDQKPVYFETLEDMYVTPAKLDCIWLTDGKKDHISQLYQADWEAENPVPENVVLFSFEESSEQEHSLYFCQDTAMEVQGEGKIQVAFYSRGKLVSGSYLEQMIFGEGNAVEYSAQQGFTAFSEAVCVEDHLVLSLDEKAPVPSKTEYNGQNGYFIRIRIKDHHPFSGFAFDEIRVASSCMRKHLESVYFKGVETGNEDFFPFGERFTDYDACYFLSNEVFGKRGARVRFSFNLDFTRIPIDLIEKEEIHWDWIMNRSNFRPDMEYDITIEEVVWEYYNGQGWKLLFDHRDYNQVFSTKNGTLGQYRTLTFICPEDMEPVLINAYEGCAVRARITKVNNLYKMKGNYITPILGNVFVNYDYGQRMLPAEHISTNNNLERKGYPGVQSGEKPQIVPFYGMEQEETSLYFGFLIPPEDGPIKILFDFLEQKPESGRTLLWEYYNGRDFVELDKVDETEHFARSGIVTLLGSHDYGKKELFGRERYWIRITDQTGGALKKQQVLLPKLTGLYMNTLRVRQREEDRTEEFHMEIYQKDMFFELVSGNVLEVQVYVDEKDLVSGEEFLALQKEHRLEPEYHSDGTIKRLFVKWNRVENFLDSKPEDRHFVLEANEGIIRFGNGTMGRILPTSKQHNVRVRYKTGGGLRTNIPRNSTLTLSRSLGFISQAYNPKELSGGQDSESLENALKRNASFIRSQKMAVTLRDYEELCRAASRNVQRVRCFTGVDDRENKRSGVVTLVVLTNDFEDGQMYFQNTRMEIENFLKPRMDTSLIREKRFFVIPPVFIEYRVHVELVAEDMDDIFSMKKEVTRRLFEFLNPLTGNFDHKGWQIGVLPNTVQLTNAINTIPGLRYVKKLFVTACRKENARVTEVDLEKAGKSRYVLPMSGEHDVVIRLN